MSIEITEKLYFKEASGTMTKTGNYIEHLPLYLKELFELEYSPIKTYLSNIRPNQKVILTISIEIGE